MLSPGAGGLVGPEFLVCNCVDWRGEKKEIKQTKALKN